MQRKVMFLFLFIFPIFIIGQVGNNWNSKKDKIIIPFDFSNNLIFLDVLVNNVSLKIII